MNSVFKVLYIDDSVDARLASRVLENATTNFHKFCMFTVVSNPFSALESIEHTTYDVIMMKEDLNLLKPHEMLNILRNVKINIPMILVKPLISTISNLSYDDLYFGIIYYPIFVPDMLTLFNNIDHHRHYQSPLTTTTSVTSSPFTSYSEDSTDQLLILEEVDWNGLLKKF